MQYLGDMLCLNHFHNVFTHHAKRGDLKLHSVAIVSLHTRTAAVLISILSSYMHVVFLWKLSYAG